MGKTIAMGCLGVLCQAWGLLWDISWHKDFGRDSLLSPPHNLILAGLLIGAGTALAGGPRQQSLQRSHPLAGRRVLFLGVVWEVLALVWDNLWHYLFGPDLEGGIWSPPHMMAVTGVAVQGMGCVVATLSDNSRESTARSLHALLACAAILTVASPALGPIEYVLDRRDPLLYPLLITPAAALVFLAGRTALDHPWGCTLIAGFHAPVRGLPPLLLWLNGNSAPGYPTPLIVSGIVIDLVLRRATMSDGRAAFLAGAAFGVLPLAEFLPVNWLAASQWPAAYQWPIGAPLLAAVPVATAGMFSGFLGWRVGAWLRATFSLPDRGRMRRPLERSAVDSAADDQLESPSSARVHGARAPVSWSGDPGSTDLSMTSGAGEPRARPAEDSEPEIARSSLDARAPGPDPPSIRMTGSPRPPGERAHP